MEPGSSCDKVIEYHQDRRFILIEYPGIVKNVDKMMETLGGMKNIQQTCTVPDKRIDLRFRPSDPCCHPVCGDKTPATSLLLRIRKYRKKKKGDSSVPDEFRYIPEIVGVVESAVKFNALCDFQYLPLSNDIENDKLVNMIPNLTVNDLSGDVYTRDVPLFLPPPTFSRFDQQQEILFRMPYKYRLNRATHPDKISIARPKRSHYAYYLKYEENWTPKEPMAAATESIRKSSNQENLLIEAKKLFEQRPIWSKNALVCLLETTHERLKNVLPALAYYFVTGPWRSLWVKFGYDPRSNPDAARFQLLNFRVRKGLNNPDIPIKVKRSTLNYRLPNLKPRGRGIQNAVSSLQDQKLPAKKKDRIHDEAVYRYTPGTLPVYRQMFYQFCDIQLPEVEEILRNHYENPGSSSCNVKSGWLQEKSAAKIRDLLTDDIYETISSKNHIKIGNQQRNVSKWNKKVAKVNLTAEDRKNATPSELVDSYHRWGMHSESSEEDTDDAYKVFEDAIDEGITFEYPEEDVDEDEESTNAIINPVENLEELPLAMEGNEVEDVDGFLDDFDAFTADIDEVEDSNTLDVD